LICQARKKADCIQTAVSYIVTTYIYYLAKLITNQLLYQLSYPGKNGEVVAIQGVAWRQGKSGGWTPGP
jgi:hypothetical protein